MKLNRIILPQNIQEEQSVLELSSLLEHLEKRDLPEASVHFINGKIDELNASSKASEEYSRKIKDVKNDILKHLQKEHNLVPENYYSTLWMTLGIIAFGLPFGVVIYAMTDNPAFIAVGLPLGIAFGFAYGALLDQKAKKEQRVLKFQKQEK